MVPKPCLLIYTVHLAAAAYMGWPADSVGLMKYTEMN